MRDYSSAPITPRLKAGLTFVEKLTLSPTELGADDVRAVMAHGVTRAGVDDLVHVSVLFNIIDRIADGLGFDVPSQEAFKAMGARLWKRGYL